MLLLFAAATGAGKPCATTANTPQVGVQTLLGQTMLAVPLLLLLLLPLCVAASDATATAADFIATSAVNPTYKSKHAIIQEAKPLEFTSNPTPSQVGESFGPQPARQKKTSSPPVVVTKEG